MRKLYIYVNMCKIARAKPLRRGVWSRLKMLYGTFWMRIYAVRYPGKRAYLEKNYYFVGGHAGIFKKNYGPVGEHG